MPIDIIPSWFKNLEDEDIIFIRRFLLASGSLKEVAAQYGVTYPTVRLRLDRLIDKIKSEADDAGDPFIGLINEMTENRKLDSDVCALLVAQYKKTKGKKDASVNHYRIVQKDRTEYLAIGGMFPHETAPADYIRMFNERKMDGTVDRLKALTKADKVTAVFCFECDLKTGLVSYHIAGENIVKASSPEFERLVMAPVTYAVFNYTGEKPLSLLEASNTVVGDFWEKWLPESGYDCLIAPDQKCCDKGFASLEVYAPEDFDADRYSFELWMPVVKKGRGL